jgi:1-deoxy-D-xylulose-5-phosphate synthase
LSYADGLAKAFELTGHRNRHVVAVVGDGALTGGMCWEALNNIAAARRPVVIVVNDNGRSYAPTFGGLANHLAMLRLQPGYEHLLERSRNAVRGMPVFGDLAYQFMHSVKVGVKDALSPQLLFTDLGLKYVGPVDGHDEHAVEAALRRARGFGAPVLVHVRTLKGRGYGPAEADEAEQMHSCGVIDPATGLATKVPGPSWTATFSESLIDYATTRRDIVAITAAMPGPTGLTAFGQRFPDRLFDVGIAEQHAMTSAAGLAMGGLHPVVAIYSTFLNRAFDQITMDVAMHKLPVTMVLDRAGITGPDGASHNGMWDLSILGVVPGMRVAAPRDGARLREELGEALDIDDGPTAIRFPKGDVGEDIPALRRHSGVDVLAVPAEGLSAEVLLVAVGAFGSMALAVAERLRNQGIGVTVIDPRWVLPVPDAVAELALAHKLVVTLEDNGVAGGVGSAVSAALRAAEIDVPCRDVGLPQQFFDHASRGEVLAAAGLTDQDVARRITGWIAALSRDDAGRDDPGRSGTIDLSGDGVESQPEITDPLD